MAEKYKFFALLYLLARRGSDLYYLLFDEMQILLRRSFYFDSGYWELLDIKDATKRTDEYPALPA